MTTGEILSLPKGLSVCRYNLDMADELSRQADNRKVWANMTDRFPSPYTKEDAVGWIKRASDETTWGSLLPPKAVQSYVDESDQAVERSRSKIPLNYAVCLNGKLIGAIGVEFEPEILFPLTATFGYWIGEEYWGHGYMTIVATAWVQWIWDTFPWVVRVQSERYGWNVVSGKVLMKAGLQFEGIQRAKVYKDKRVADLYLYGIARPGLQYEPGRS